MKLADEIDHEIRMASRLVEAYEKKIRSMRDTRAELARQIDIDRTILGKP